MRFAAAHPLPPALCERPPRLEVERQPLCDGREHLERRLERRCFRFDDVEPLPATRYEHGERRSTFQERLHEGRKRRRFTSGDAKRLPPTLHERRARLSKRRQPLCEGRERRCSRFGGVQPKASMLDALRETLLKYAEARAEHQGRQSRGSHDRRLLRKRLSSNVAERSFWCALLDAKADRPKDRPTTRGSRGILPPPASGRHPFSHFPGGRVIARLGDGALLGCFKSTGTLGRWDVNSDIGGVASRGSRRKERGRKHDGRSCLDGKERRWECPQRLVQSLAYAACSARARDRASSISSGQPVLAS